jgi:hypothetical protein
VCAKEIKPELNTLDEADFVRDVDKSASCSRKLAFADGLGRIAPDNRRWHNEVGLTTSRSAVSSVA